MNGWRGTWAAAQITGVIFSSLVWIVVWGLSLPAPVVTAAIGLALVIGRNTRPMLWWRFGATPANDFQRDTILVAIVPIASLRGRRQPSVWIGRRIIADVVMPSSSILVVSPTFVGQVANGQLTDRQASAIISQTLGVVEVIDSALVNALDVYCLPWRIVQVPIAMVRQFAARHRTLRISWSIRWIVFGVAIVDNYLNARWAAFVGVILVALLSWTTGFLQKRWDGRLQDLGDQTHYLRRPRPRPRRPHPAQRPLPRHRRASRPTPLLSWRNDRSRRPAGRRPQPSRAPVNHLERRSCPGRWNS